MRQPINKHSVAPIRNSKVRQEKEKKFSASWLFLSLNGINVNSYDPNLDLLSCKVEVMLFLVATVVAGGAHISSMKFPSHLKLAKLAKSHGNPSIDSGNLHSMPGLHCSGNLTEK